jgi:hypothetical protein
MKFRFIRNQFTDGCSRAGVNHAMSSAWSITTTGAQDDAQNENFSTEQC